VLGLEHPRTGETLRLESAIPADMERLLAALRAPRMRHQATRGTYVRQRTPNAATRVKTH
jgi:hypothetical protein